MSLLLSLLLTCYSLAGAQDMLPVEDLEKDGTVNAIHQSLDGKFSVRGGTMTGAFFPSSTTVRHTLDVDGAANFGSSADFDTTVNVDGELTASSATITNQLDVNGTILMGWERVTATGNQTNATVDCSSGKKLLGGGCSKTADTFGESYPSDDDTWTCVYATGSGGNVTAYALCARVGS